MINLFDDQAESIDKLRTAMRNYKSVLLQGATGSGKTVMAIWLIGSAMGKRKRVIFTVPRRQLLKQTSDAFDEYGLDHGYIASGMPFNPYSKTYVGMVDTMARRIKEDDDGKIISSTLPDADVVFFDETRFGQTSLDRVISYYKSRGAWIIGLDATPWKLSGQGLGCWYDYMVCGPSMRWLIDNKRLSDYRFFRGKTSPDLSGLSVNAGDYAKGELADFMEGQRVIIGDCVNEYMQRAMGRLHVVRCASIKHSQMTAQAFRDAGVPTMHVDGKTPDDVMRKIIRAYARREIYVLTFCDLLNFGFDLSMWSGMDVCVESGSDLKPSLSLAGVLQFWGRMLRYKPQPAIIMDHVNNYMKHGLPCADREWTLSDRKQTKKNTEPVPPTKQCDNCFYIFSPVPACPECGYVNEIKSREVKTVDGELEEIDPKAEIIEQRKTAKSIANDLIHDRDNVELKKNDENTLEYLIGKFTREGAKNPTAKAAHVLAARMAKQGSR